MLVMFMRHTVTIPLAYNSIAFFISETTKQNEWKFYVRNIYKMQKVKETDASDIISQLASTFADTGNL